MITNPVTPPSSHRHPISPIARCRTAPVHFGSASAKSRVEKIPARVCSQSVDSCSRLRANSRHSPFPYSVSKGQIGDGLRCRLRSIRIDRRIDAKAALPPGAVAEGQYNVFQRLLQQHAATIKGDAQLGSPRRRRRRPCHPQGTALVELSRSWRSPSHIHIALALAKAQA